MATLAPTRSWSPVRDRFFPNLALAMVVVMVAGFANNYVMGRSSFVSPPLTHVHAVAFMGWLGIFVVQSNLGVGESRRLHRKLGWIAAVWAVALIVLGCAIIVSMLRRGVTPFFFQPQHLMVGDPLTLLAFAALTVAAIRMRRRTDWHSRLHISAMTMLMGPGVGRLLPLPLLEPYAFEVACLVGLVFPLIGAWRDKRRSGRVHPAWLAAFVAMSLVLVSARAIAFSPVGDLLYRVVTAGSKGATVAGRSFGAPPSGPVALRVVPRTAN